MLDRLTGKSVHLYIHIFACCLIAAGLPASKIPLSLGTILLPLNLLMKADFRHYAANLREYKIAWPFWVFLILNLLSILWSSDMEYAMQDLRIKLPLFVIPLALVCYPVKEQKHLRTILLLFLASLFITSFINVGTYKHWWGNKVYDDFRGLSLFGSHIRYALLIAAGSAICICWFIYKLPYRFLAVILGAWFVWYINFSQILSGHLVFGGVASVFIIWLLWNIRSKKLKLIFTLLISSALLALLVFITAALTPVPHKVSLENLPQYTENGNWYRHTTKTQTWENGYPVVAFISEVELEPAWNKTSDIDYKTGLDAKSRPIDYTLWLYMTSKGLHKDSAGFSKMTKQDVRNVEKGYTSILLVKQGFRTRLYELRHEMEHPENPNGHTLLQRIEYWKAGLHIAGKNWFTGVGAGDVDTSFRTYYKQTNSLLIPDLQHRSHNQYLTILIATGIFGLLAFMIAWFLFFREAWRNRAFLSLSFIAISLLSFLIEDTLETQVGVTFVAFFYGLLLVIKEKESELKD